MPHLSCYLPHALELALQRRHAQTGMSKSHIVHAALATYFDAELHTLFQISTARSLVAGVFDGAVTVADIERRGDFGLGTFAGLDGEMVVLDGVAYQIHGDGSVEIPSAATEAPFAVVTFFDGGAPLETGAIDSLEALKAACDAERRSDNVFYAFRVDGRFRTMRTRAICPPKPGVTLAEAAKTQSEFDFADVEGTLVGFWEPEYSASFSVPGYHFHFISADRSMGGHVLRCAADSLQLRAEEIEDFHLSLPESAPFLQANLRQDTTAELAAIEEAPRHGSGGSSCDDAGRSR